MKANGMQKKKMTGNGFLLLITIALFAVMYIAGMIIFADKGFAKPQMFLNLFVSNAENIFRAYGITFLVTIVGTVSTMVITDKNFIAIFKLFDITEAKASIVPLKISL